MPQTKEEFLQILAVRQILPPEVLSNLRALANEAGEKAQPRHLAKWLVDNGHLTQFQAQKLLAERLEDVSPSGRADEDADLEVVEGEEPEYEEDLLEEADEPQAGHAPSKPAPGRGAWSGSPPARSAAPTPAPPPYAPPPHAAAPAYGGYPPGGAPMMGMPPGSMPPGYMPPGAAPPVMGGPPGSYPPGSFPLGSFPPGSLPPGSYPPGMMMPDGTIAGGPPPGAAAPGAPGGRSKRLNEPASDKKKPVEWGTKLILILGGVVVTLVILVALLPLAIARQAGEEDFNKAEGEYQKGNYSQAREHFEKFLKKHPKHSSVSLARVHQGLAAMRIPRDAHNWPLALKTATEELQRISQEKTFSDNSADVKVMLPDIYEGLAEQGRNPPSADLLKQAADARKLMDSYVPLSGRSDELQQRMKNVEDSLEVTQALLSRNERLEDTVKKIRESLEQQDTESAYASRNEIVKLYPDLAPHALLQEAMASAVEIERKRMVFAPGVIEPLAESAVSVEGTLILASRQGSTVEGVDGQVAFALGGGAAYGLDAASGRVLWRYYVGFDSTMTPIAVGAGGRGGVLVFDATRLELVRLETATGKLLWRFPLGDQMIGSPVVLGERVAVATRSGFLTVIELLSGRANGRMKVSQPLAAGPSTDSRQRFIYLAGQQSALFIITPDGTNCHAAFYLGHESGTVRIPPMVFSRYMVVAENLGLNNGVLRVYVMDEDVTKLEFAQRLDVEGHVTTPPVTAGKMLLVVTNRGALHAFEASTPDLPPSITVVSTKGPSEGKPATRYLQVAGQQAFVAENQLVRYDVQTARGQLSPKWIKFKGDASRSAPQVAGTSIVYSSVRPGRPGTTVTALRIDDGGTIWETLLGAPLVGEVVPSKNSLVALNSTGALFDVKGSDATFTGAVVEAAKTLTLPDPIAAGAWTERTEKGTILVSSASTKDRAMLFDLDPKGEERLRLMALPGPLGAPPVLLGNRLAVATSKGPLAILDLSGGNSVCEPYQPRVEAGGGPPWSSIASHESGAYLVAADGQGRLFRLEISEGTSASLKVAAERPLDRVIVSRIAVLERAALSVDSADRLVTAQLPGLETLSPEPLGGKLSFGPARVGPYGLLSLDNGFVRCYGPNGAQLWQGTIPSGHLSGVKLEGKHLIFCSTGGSIWTVDAESGVVVTSLEVGQPLGGPVVRQGDAWYAPGHDGTIHRLPSGSILPEN